MTKQLSMMQLPPLVMGRPAIPPTLSIPVILVPPLTVEFLISPRSKRPTRPPRLVLLAVISQPSTTQPSITEAVFLKNPATPPIPVAPEMVLPLTVQSFIVVLSGSPAIPAA